MSAVESLRQSGLPEHRQQPLAIVVASNPQQMRSHIANVKVALLHEAMLNGADEPVAEGASPLQVYPLQRDVLRLRRRRRRTWLLAESTGHLLQAFLALVQCPGGSDRRLRKGPPS